MLYFDHERSSGGSAPEILNASPQFTGADHLTLGAGENVSKRSSGQPRCNGYLNQVFGMEDGLWVTIKKVNQCEERQWEKQHCRDASEPIKDILQSSSHCPSSSNRPAVTQRGLRIFFTSERNPTQPPNVKRNMRQF
jgi:hypothetical protein